MFSEFLVYCRLGLGHIADLKGYDHILFLVALTAGYSAQQWRALLWLVTAFTVGHSVTLALATLQLVPANPAVVEPLIAVTIAATGALGLLRSRGQDKESSSPKPLYVMAGAFGLIHGLGFSSFLRSMLGSEEGITWPLFSFNVGLELGQLAIVSAIILLGAVCCNVAGLSRRVWSSALSAVAMITGLKLLWDRVAGG